MDFLFFFFWVGHESKVWHFRFDPTSVASLKQEFHFSPDLKQNYFSFFLHVNWLPHNSLLLALGTPLRRSWAGCEMSLHLHVAAWITFNKGGGGGGGASGDGESARRLINSWSLFVWDTYQLLVAAGRRANNKPLSWVSGSNSGGTFGKKCLFNLAIRLYGAALSCITRKQDENKEIHQHLSRYLLRPLLHTVRWKMIDSNEDWLDGCYYSRPPYLFEGKGTFITLARRHE